MCSSPASRSASSPSPASARCRRACPTVWTREGRTLLGGDIAFSLIQREAKPEERAFLATQGTGVVVATMRGMVRAADGQLALVELKSVDGAYPTLGRITAEPQLPMNELLAERDGAFGAAADAVLLARLGLKIGDRVTVGVGDIRNPLGDQRRARQARRRRRPWAALSDQRSRACARPSCCSRAAWCAGSIAIKLPDAAASEAAVLAARRRRAQSLPDAGWEIRSRGNASPQLERNINRFTQFLTLVGLAALLVGGVGVANAVKSHLDRKRDVIATLKALGATGDGVFAIYLVQIVLLALVGSLIGLVVGAALPFAVVGVLGKLLPLPIQPAVHASDLALSLVYGLLTALAFALWPLGRVHDIPVATLFRETTGSEWRWPTRRYLLMMAAVIALLIAVAVGLAYDRRVALIFIGSSAAVFVLLRLISSGVMARRAAGAAAAHDHAAAGDRQHPPPRRADAVGGAVARSRPDRAGDDHADRPQPAAPVHGAAAGEGAVVLLRGYSGRRRRALRRVSQRPVPGGKVERVPMLRGRIVEARGLKAEELKPSTDAAWVLQSDRGLTYTGEIPSGSKVVEGQWWGADYSGPPLVSFEKKLADGLGLKLGDSVMNVLGRNVTPRSPTCAPSTGRTSASTSCWCSRPTPFAARRTPISPP